MSNIDTLDSAGLLTISGMLSTPIGSAGIDHALEVLLAVRAESAVELPEELLRQCYAIQKRFQFDRDEQLPIVHTRRLIESFVEHEISLLSGRDAENGV